MWHFALGGVGGGALPAGSVPRKPRVGSWGHGIVTGMALHLPGLSLLLLRGDVVGFWFLLGSSF